MNRPSFEKTVDVLVKAYLNGTLEHGNCYACAVGNIIADSCGYKYIQSKRSCQKWEWETNTPKWYNSTDGLLIECPQTEATGYTIIELSKIERAFENERRRAYREEYTYDYMFNGLMAVVDVLAEIHKIDLTAKEQAKQLFVKV